MNPHLNEKTEATEKVIHLLVTSLCDRNCKYCCNKQYSLDEISTVTDEELRKAEVICLTGGEPFKYSNPCAIAAKLKRQYKNIRAVYVYTNAAELALYIMQHEDNKLACLDGLNVSLKCKADTDAFEKWIVDNRYVKDLPSNLLYVFDEADFSKVRYHGNFTYKERSWQPDFKPASDSIFRRI